MLALLAQRPAGGLGRHLWAPARYTERVPATVVIGDVHGCSHELSTLIQRCDCGPDAQLVLVGDLVAKGPDSRGVLALVRKWKARAVLGNHDAHVLRWKQAMDSGLQAPSLRPSHARVARELDESDWSLLASLPYFLRLPEHNAVVVHAGLVPGIPLERQDPNMLLNLRTIRPNGSGSRSATEGVLWGSLYHGPELVLFGHHARAGLQRHPFAIGLDTGCVYGDRLTAYVLPEGRFVSVPAARRYVSTQSERE